MVRQLGCAREPPMKPLHIVLLIAAGALGGAVVMKVSERRQTTAAAPLVAQAPPAPAPVATLPAEDRPPSDRPSPLTPPREMPKPGRTHTRRQPPPPVQPATMVAVTPAPAPAISPTPEPVAPAPAPQPDPPARPEPEHVTPPPAPPAPPEPHRVTLNAGTLIPVRLVDGLTSERNLPGDLFTATLDKALGVDGFAIAERGARVEGRVVASDRGGRVSGVASLAVEITRLRLSDGQTVSLSTDSFERRAEASRSEDAAKVGAGAA